MRTLSAQDRSLVLFEYSHCIVGSRAIQLIRLPLDRPLTPNQVRDVDLGIGLDVILRSYNVLC